MLPVCKLCGQPIHDTQNCVKDGYGCGFDLHANCLAGAINPMIDLVGHAREFNQRVDAGEVRSKRTYANFKDVLDRYDAVQP